MQLRAIQLIEKHPVDEAATKEEGQQFYAQALNLEPNNSMVLATLANSLRRFGRDDAHSLFLAERSVRLNPANSFAWWALSAASSYVGRAEVAYRDAQVARRMAILSPHRFWWDNQVYTSALISGRIGEALKFAEAAHAGNPEFRPPLRYLIALHASEGNMEEALVAAAKLQRLEPEFTIERLLNDESYPASLIHSAPNLRKERIASLI
jgi:tetratricopeptide (TPR) repeat protein